MSTHQLNSTYNQSRIFTNDSDNLTKSCVPSDEIINRVVQSSKIINVLFFLIYLLALIKFPQLRTKPMVFLNNLFAIDFVLLIYGILTSDPYLFCHVYTKFSCHVLSLYQHYYNFVYAFGVITLSIYRCLCILYSDINRRVNVKMIVIAIAINWLAPFPFIITAVLIELPVKFSVNTLTCRLYFPDTNVIYFDYYIVYLLSTCILPTLLIVIINVVIIYRLKQIKKRVHSTTITTRTVTTETATRLSRLNPKDFIKKHFKMSTIGLPKRQIIQLSVLYFVFILFEAINIIFYTQIQNPNSIFTPQQMSAMQIIYWITHTINPIVYLIFHPLVYSNVKKLIKIAIAKLIILKGQNL